MTRINLNQYRVCLESNGECVCKGDVETVADFLGISTCAVSAKCRNIRKGIEKNRFRGRNDGYQIFCDENVLLEEKKICGKCKKKLPLTRYGIKKNSAGKKYYNTICIDCYNELQRERYNAKPKAEKKVEAPKPANVIHATNRDEIDFSKLALVDKYVKGLESQIEEKLKLVKINDSQHLGASTVNDIMRKINTCVNVATAGIIQFISENGQAGLDACNERVRASNISRFD